VLRFGSIPSGLKRGGSLNVHSVSAAEQSSFVLRSGGRGKEILHRPHFVAILKTVKGDTPSIGMDI